MCHEKRHRGVEKSHETKPLTISVKTNFKSNHEKNQMIKRIALHAYPPCGASLLRCGSMRNPKTNTCP
jgi:hypothetical protein